MKNTDNLESSNLWQSSQRITHFMIAILEKHADEMQYPLDFRTRDCAMTMTGNIAAAIGSIDPRDKVWQLGKSRSAIFELKGIYKLLHDMKIVKIDPDIMLKFDELKSQIDKEIAISRSDIKFWYEEMESPVRQTA